MKLRIALLLALAAITATAQQPLASRRPQPIIQEAPRLVLTKTEDEQPMQTREMTVDTRIRGLHAEVETTIVFHNPNSRILEGELVFPLPDGAVVSGYALDVNGTLVDGVVVKKEKARIAFEAETRQRVDPGIVEHVKGNIYRTRVYPLPARGERTIRLRYVTELTSDADGDTALHLALPRETIGKLNIKVQVNTDVSSSVGGVHAAAPEIGGFGNLHFARAENTWLAETTLVDTTPGADILVALPKLPKLLAALERDATGDVYFTLSDLPESGRELSAPPPPSPAPPEAQHWNNASVYKTASAVSSSLRVRAPVPTTPSFDWNNSPNSLAALDANPQNAAQAHMNDVFWRGPLNITCEDNSNIHFTLSAPSQHTNLGMSRVLSAFKNSVAYCNAYTATLINVRPALPASQKPMYSTLRIAWDTSRSRETADLERELAFLKTLAEQSGASAFALLPFSNAPAKPQAFHSFDGLRNAIEKLHYDSGTDFNALTDGFKLASMMLQGSSSLWDPRITPGPWFIFTDGIDTHNETVKDSPIPLTAVVSQTTADREALRQLCNGSLVDLQRLDTAAAVALALNPPRRVTGIEGTGIADVQGIGALVSGRVMLTGRLTAPTAELRITYSDGTRSDPVKLDAATATSGRLLPTVWAAGRVTRLSTQPEENEDELLDLGRRFGLVSPATSLIVLENLAQYIRHEIEPPEQLADMRRQWQTAMNRRPKTTPAENKLETVVRMWKQRVAWWEGKDRPTKATGTERNSTARPDETRSNALGEVSRVWNLPVRAPSPETTTAESSAQRVHAPTIDTSSTPESRININNGVAVPETSVSLPSPASMPSPAPPAASTITTTTGNPLNFTTIVQKNAATDEFVAGDLGGATDRAVSQPRNLYSAWSGGFDSTSGSQGGTRPVRGVEGRFFGDIPSDTEASARIQITAWNPDVPYLKRLRAAEPAEREAIYLEEAKTNVASPGFFLDCADFFFEQGNKPLALRVLSNLAELRIEDPALLRVYAWRLQQAGDFDRAITLLRRVTRLRPEDPQSWRDLALALTERGKRSIEQVKKQPIFTQERFLEIVAEHGKRLRAAASDLAEAQELFKKVILTPWNRTREIELFALEELNALMDWIERADWPEKPALVALDERLRKNLDLDLRVVMSWDADATDIDLHVIEPSGEEAYFSHNRTAIGGLVTADITDGYGPEAYLLRAAPDGLYTVRANYFGSRQQTLLGPVTVTARVFTNWGRENETSQLLTLRLDKTKDKVEIGKIKIGDGSDWNALDLAKLKLRSGLTESEITKLLGKPARTEDNAWFYTAGKREWKFLFDDGKLLRAVELLPGNAEMIIVQ